MITQAWKALPTVAAVACRVAAIRGRCCAGLGWAARVLDDQASTNAVRGLDNFISRRPVRECEVPCFMSLLLEAC